MYRFGIIVMTIAASLFVGSAVAQNPQQDAQNAAPSAPPDAAAPQNSAGDPVHNMIGAWEFSNADHDKICHFNFRADTAPNGYKLDIDKNCPSLFPSTKNMVAWSVDNFGSLRLLDASGNSVVDLSEVETGMYDGFTPEEGRYILQAATSAPQLSASDVAGDWAVTRGAGKPICILTLANNSLVGDVLAPAVRAGSALGPGAGQDQPADERGPGEGDVLGDEAAEGEAEQVRPGQADRVGEGDDLPCGLGDRVRGQAGGGADAGVVDEDDLPLGRQGIDERRVPVVYVAAKVLEQ